MGVSTILRPMVYTCMKTFVCLCEGYYEKYHFAIMSLGTHPSVYIEIPTDHKYYGKSYESMNISCHSGVTYAASELGSEGKTFHRSGFWIGWDYAHTDTDYLGYNMMLPPELQGGGKKWTTEELYDEVRNVIDQLIQIQTDFSQANISV